MAIFPSSDGGYSNGNVVVRRTSGPNTGDEMIQTADGTWWLVVQYFPAITPSTGERRGILIDGTIRE